VGEVGAASEGGFWVVGCWSVYFRLVQLDCWRRTCPWGCVFLGFHGEFHACVAAGGFGAVHVDLDIFADGEGLLFMFRAFGVSSLADPV
jgi:hypothetical protein